MMPRRYLVRIDLPDVNVLLALLDPMHPHHETANAWFAGPNRLPYVYLLGLFCASRTEVPWLRWARELRLLPSFLRTTICCTYCKDLAISCQAPIILCPG